LKYKARSEGVVSFRIKTRSKTKACRLAGSEIAGLTFHTHLNDAPLSHGRAGKFGGGGDDLRLVSGAVRKATIVLHRPSAIVLYDSKYER